MKQLRFCFLAFMLLILTFNYSISFNDIVPDPLEYKEMPFDVLHYDVKLDLSNYKTKEVEGICKILVHRKNIYDGDYFIFHLEGLKVDGVSSMGKNLDFKAHLEDNPREFHYRVSYPDQTSDTVEFIISYSGTMTSEINPGMSWGGVSYEELVLYSMGAGLGAPYISTTRHWLPCFDLPQDKATFKGTFIVPNNLKVASNGILTEVNDSDEGKKEFVWEHNYLAATYLLNFAAGPYIILDNFDYKIPIQIFTLAMDSIKSEFAYRRVPEMADCYSSLFGEYPYEKIGYCNTMKGAMEHQTMISFPRSIIINQYTYKNDNNSTMAHELAHHWFGNMVSPLDFRDTWLNESFANYCEALWEKCREGDSAYLATIIMSKDEYLGNVVKREGVLPLYDYSREKPSSNYPTTIYEKGSVVLGMLYYELEKNGFDFIEIIRNYLNKYKHSNVDTKQFIQLVKDETNLDLDWFYDQWVYNAGWLQLDVEYDDIQNEKYPSRFRLIQTQLGRLFENVPVEFSYYINGEEFTFVQPISDSITYIDLGNDINYKIDSIKFNTGKIVVGLFKINNIKVISSVNDNNKNLPYELYQFNNNINLNYQSETGKTIITIYDLLGNVIYKEEKQSNYGMNSFSFDFNNYPQNNYFINIIIDNNVYNEKISVIH